MGNPRSCFLLLLIFMSSSQWLVHCQDTGSSSASASANPTATAPITSPTIAAPAATTPTTTTPTTTPTTTTPTTIPTTIPTTTPTTTTSTTIPTTTLTTTPTTTAAPPAPTAIVLKSLTTTSIEIEWNTTAAFTYIVVTGPEDEHAGNWTVSSPTRVENVTGLHPGTTYKVQLYSLNAKGEAIRDEFSKSNNFSTALASITAPEVSHVSTSSLNINWTNPNGSWDYIEIKCSSDCKSVNITDQSITTAELDGLTAGRRYEFDLTAWKGSLSGDTVSLGDSTEPASVTNLSLSTPEEGAILVTWSTSGDFEHIYVSLLCASTGSECDSASISNSNNPTSNTKFENLAEGDNYTVFITVNSYEKNSAEKSESIVLKPAAVTDLTLAVSQEDTIRVTWSASGVYESIYLSLCAASNGSCSKRQIEKTSDSSYVKDFVNGTRGEEYTVAVVVNSFGMNSTSESRTVVLKPASVTNLSLSTPEEGTVLVTWSTSGEFQYIYVSLLCASTGSECDSASISNSNNSTSNNTKFENLAEGDNYTVVVTVNSYGKNSTEKSASIILKPAAVIDLTLTVSQEDTIRVSWSTSGVYESIYLSLCAASNAECSEHKISTQSSPNYVKEFKSRTRGEKYTVAVVVNSNEMNSTSENRTVVMNPLQMSVFNASNPSVSDVELMWSNDAVWSHVTICCRGGDSESRNCTDSTTVNYPKANYTFSNLTYGDQFNCSSQVESYGEPASDPQQFTDIVIPPTAPVWFNHSLSGNKITLRWTDGDGIRDNYFLTCSPSLVGCGRIDVNSGDVELTVELTVVWGETYTFSLIAQSNGADSATETITDVEIDLIVPTGLIAEAVPDQNQTAIKLMWDELQNASFTNFKLTCQPNATNSSCPNDELIFSNTTRNHTISNLTSGETYSFTLRTNLNGRESEETSPVTRTTFYAADSSPISPIDAPSLSLKSGTSFALNVSWLPLSSNKSSGVIVEYKLRYRAADDQDADAGHWSNSKTVLGSETSVKLEQLEPFTNYTVQIRAATKPENLTLYGPWSSSQTFRTGEYFPEAPSSLTLVPTARNISVSWTLPSKPNGVILEYLIQYQLANGTEISVTNTATAVTLTEGINPYTLYTVWISARTTYSETGQLWGNRISKNITTQQSAPSGPPERLNVISFTNISIDISWAEPKRSTHNGVIRGYLVTVTTDSDVPTDVFMNTTRDVYMNTTWDVYMNTTRHIARLYPFTEYRIQVRAYTVEGTRLDGPPASINQTTRASVRRVVVKVTSSSTGSISAGAIGGIVVSVFLVLVAVVTLIVTARHRVLCFKRSRSENTSIPLPDFRAPDTEHRRTEQESGAPEYEEVIPDEHTSGQTLHYQNVPPRENRSTQSQIYQNVHRGESSLAQPPNYENIRNNQPLTAPAPVDFARVNDSTNDGGYQSLRLEGNRSSPRNGQHVYTQLNV